VKTALASGVVIKLLIDLSSHPTDSVEQIRSTAGIAGGMGNTAFEPF